MVLISHFLFGFITSFVGSITPSMLNMTALKVSLQTNEKAGNKFAVGVAIVVFFQAYIAILITNIIFKNPAILETIEKLGIVIFTALSIYFFRESNNDKKSKQEKKTELKNPILTGLTLSLLNMFAIPFFVAVIVTLDVFNVFSFETIPKLFFIFGSCFGTYFILYLYVKYAKKIQKKTGRITKDINILLSFLTAFIAFFSIVKLVYKTMNP